MLRLDLLVSLATIALEIPVLACLIRRGVAGSFRTFAGYLSFVLLETVVGTAVLSSPRSYFYFYWATTPVEILLTILAVLESFWKVFRVFRLMRWFRFVLPLAIALALGYSAWQGFRFPPIDASPLTAALVNMTVTLNYVILTVVILFFALVAYLGVAWRIHEFRFILGFGVASLAASFGGTVRALFGGSFEGLSREAQPVGYILALLIWLSAAIRPLPEEAIAAMPSGEQLKWNLELLKNQLHNIRSFARKGRR